MYHEHSLLKGADAVLQRGAQVAALCLVAATSATAQPADGLPQCHPVGGSVMTSFVRQDRTLGTATGDLRGAVSADLLGVAQGPDGTTIFTVQHHWVTETGDTLDIPVAQATATQVAPGLFAVLSYPVAIQGGTGRFGGASGTVWNIGEVDLNAQRTVFRYHGEVCFRTPFR